MTLWRHLFGYMPVNLANGLVGFGSVYVFTRLLGAEDYGRYALMLSALHVIHTATLTWAEAATYRFTGQAEAQGRLASHYRTASLLAVLSLGPALMVVGLAWLILGTDSHIRPLLLWIGGLMPLYTFINIALETHKAERRVARYSMVETSRVLGGFVVGALLAWLTGLGAAAPFAGMIVAGAVFFATEGGWLLRKSLTGRVDWAKAGGYFAYGAPIAAALVLDLILSASDRFLIAYFLNEAAVGAYSAGYGVADKTILMICAWGAMAGSPLLMAAFEQGKATDLRTAGEDMLRLMLLVAVPAAVGIALVAEPLATFMISEDLRDQAMKTIPWIAMAGLLNGLLIYYFTEPFQLRHRTGLRAALMLVPAILNIALNIYLLPRIGLMGAVYATVACYAVALLLLAAVGRRLLALPFPFLDLGKILFACGGMAAVVLALPSLGGFLELIVKATLGGLAYGGAVLLLDAGGARTQLQGLRQRLRGSKSPSTA